MEVTCKEQKRAEQLLQSLHIGLHQIKSFSFMKRHRQAPRKNGPAPKDKYGPGILTLHLKEGNEKAIYLPPFRHPSSVIRYLVSQKIPFLVYKAEVHSPRIYADTVNGIACCHRLAQSVFHVLKQSREVPIHMLPDPHLTIRKAMDFF